MITFLSAKRSEKHFQNSYKMHEMHDCTRKNACHIIEELAILVEVALQEAPKRDDSMCLLSKGISFKVVIFLI